MNSYLRASPLMALGFITDTLRAGVSVGIVAVAAHAGTLGGAAAGCLVGSKVAGSAGCAAGVAIFGFLGTALNPISGGVLLPIGIMLAVVVSFAISLSFGTVLVTLLIFTRMFYPHQVFLAYLAAIVPILPGWTMLAIRAAHRKNKEEGAQSHAALA